MHNLLSISTELKMKLKEIIEQLKLYQSHHQVIAMTDDGEKISTTFDLYTCPIHSNVFSVYGIIDKTNHLHIINNKDVIKALETTPINSTKRGYKGQEIDYVEPEDREILFTNNLKSIYCGKYKYLMIVDICKSNKDEIIIRCKGR